MPTGHLGRGWSFPVEPDDATHSLVYAVDEQKIQQAIIIILGTSRGERVMRPDFGCGLHDLVFAVNNATTHGRVIHEVRQALLQWEPRIDLLDVRVDAGGDGEALMIRIDYRVRATNTRLNLVYPFYLERSVA